MRLRRSVLPLLLILLTVPAAAQTPRVLAPSGQWVTDAADLLTPGEERLLSQRLAGFADTTSTQIIIVTVPSLDGAAPVDYAVALGRAWGVGQQGRDNGIVVLVAKAERQIYIATGFGLEGAIPDVLAGRIVRRLVEPRFREGRFYDGLSDATDALMLAASGEFDALPADRSPDALPLLALAFIVLVILILVFSAARHGGSGGGSGGVRYRSRSGPVIIWGSPGFGHRSGGFGGGGFGGGGFGGFGGGGGSFGGGGAGGSW